MEAKKQNPRYNIVSCRVSDELRQSIKHTLGNRSVQNFLHSAIEEKLIEERQARIDRIVRKARNADQT